MQGETYIIFLGSFCLVENFVLLTNIQGTATS